jgi:DNA adenine methylase
MKENNLTTNSPYSEKAVNVASVPQWSPFRYPGGKTWLVPTIRKWLRTKIIQPKLFIEPFAGGGIVSLTVAFEKLSDQILMVELDEEVAAVWQAIIEGDGQWLAETIRNFDLTVDNVNRILTEEDQTIRHRAFRTILKNRVYHGGILAPGSGMIKYGENGKGISSRWYPSTLSKRILSIHHIRSRIQFMHGDGLEIIDRYKDDPDVCFFIDPPYTASKKRAGARLYKYFELDHAALFSAVENIKGDFIMTYDDADEIASLAQNHGLMTQKIKMKNTHHMEMQELVIASQFNWW